MWLSGNEKDPPTPTGLALADIFTGANATQGILAALLGRSVSGKGQLVETSLLECLIDLQFEMLSDYLNKGRRRPRRSAIGNANVHAPAPYGVYRTSDGYLAIAMTPIERLAGLLGINSLKTYVKKPERLYSERDAIKSALAERLRQKTTSAWLAILQPADIWCAEVLEWEQLLCAKQCELLDMFQALEGAGGFRFETTRIPLRLDGVRPACRGAAPRLGEHGAAIRAELGVEAPATTLL
ncbi:MAG: CoA transferase [Alphaproteobacteria bacterium]|nr:MAG: CoA transferase [Alphaproteobacteria bacterium]